MVFAFTGSPQTRTVPSGVASVQVEAFGAQGGGGYGGFGAEVLGHSGGQSGSAVDRSGRRAGFARGGWLQRWRRHAVRHRKHWQRPGGGGASDIRVDGDHDAHRAYVAAGGGGGAGGPTFGMGGSRPGARPGNLARTAGAPTTGRGGASATLTAPGDLGGDFACAGSEASGGSGGFTAGGGGGGYLGGGGGGGDSSGGSPGGRGALGQATQGQASRPPHMSRVPAWATAA